MTTAKVVEMGELVFSTAVVRALLPVVIAFLEVDCAPAFVGDGEIGRLWYINVDLVKRKALVLLTVVVGVASRVVGDGEMGPT